eukprot:4152120-Heterocapsa_arctica.AAC.1
MWRRNTLTHKNTVHNKTNKNTLNKWHPTQGFTQRMKKRQKIRRKQQNRRKLTNTLKGTWTKKKRNNFQESAVKK